jgi:hypothetical protein
MSVARLNPVEVAVDVELQKNRRMITWPARRKRLNPAKIQAVEIKLIDKDLELPASLGAGSHLRP